uniref:Uncharacterized protein n=1 Tax=Vitrella brassicaformis TaxID=1169539 RepID=A0A7S1PCA1_9ALVE|mmetsp:Transcript_32824/g.94740  ORF Transcript_32824/g.94740 Transcript_32824/m.94740 type:complete len:179 (-) Transcript_32824:299-835(-)
MYLLPFPPDRPCLIHQNGAAEKIRDSYDLGSTTPCEVPPHIVTVHIACRIVVGRSRSQQLAVGHPKVATCVDAQEEFVSSRLVVPPQVTRVMDVAQQERMREGRGTESSTGCVPIKQEHVHCSLSEGCRERAEILTVDIRMLPLFLIPQSACKRVKQTSTITCHLPQTSPLTCPPPWM